jgi:hypothetical protein
MLLRVSLNLFTSRVSTRDGKYPSSARMINASIKDVNSALNINFWWWTGVAFFKAVIFSCQFL